MERRLLNSTEDRLIHVTACDDEVRCVAAVTTGLVSEAAQRHQTSPTASAALGRALTAGLLLGTMLKDVERITLVFQCDGPIGGMMVDADAHGNVRGYVKNPRIDLPLNGKNKFDVSGIVGKGMLYVIREGGYYELGVYQEPYRGSVPIVSGEIAEDVAYYLSKSEQIPSAVSLGVFIVPDGSARYEVAGAGGFLVQIFPGAHSAVVDKLEKSINQMPYVTEMIRDGSGPREILDTALGEYGFRILEEKPVRFICNCSYERAVRIISAIDPKELKDMLLKDGGAEMVCHFCSAVYRIDRETLSVILERETSV
jgi:molecular chaperone Hsp33